MREDRISIVSKGKDFSCDIWFFYSGATDDSILFEYVYAI